MKTFGNETVLSVSGLYLNEWVLKGRRNGIRTNPNKVLSRL